MNFFVTFYFTTVTNSTHHQNQQFQSYSTRIDPNTENLHQNTPLLVQRNPTKRLIYITLNLATQTAYQNKTLLVQQNQPRHLIYITVNPALQTIYQSTTLLELQNQPPQLIYITVFPTAQILQQSTPLLVQQNQPPQLIYITIYPVEESLYQITPFLVQQNQPSQLANTTVNPHTQSLYQSTPFFVQHNQHPHSTDITVNPTQSISHSKSNNRERKVIIPILYPSCTVFGIKLSITENDLYLIQEINNFSEYEDVSCYSGSFLQRKEHLDIIKKKLMVVYLYFNTWKHKEKWILVQYGNQLYMDGTDTYINETSLRKDIKICLYMREINNNRHFAIIDKSAHISSGFVWSGNVYIGRRTIIGYGVQLDDGVAILDDCLIGTWTHIERLTLVDEKTFIDHHLQIGEKNIFREAVRVYKIERNEKKKEEGKFPDYEFKYNNALYICCKNKPKLAYLGLQNLFLENKQWDYMGYPINGKVYGKKPNETKKSNKANQK